MITIYDFINMMCYSHKYTCRLAVEGEDETFINEMTAEGACALFGNRFLTHFYIETDTRILLIIPRGQRNPSGRELLQT